MKTQIRHGVFETNSSSTHAICISKNRDISKLEFPDVVSFTHGEFGWENGTLRDVWNKASYLYEAIIGTYGNDSVDDKLEHIKEILKNQGIACDFEPCSDDIWDDGYIDHVGTDDMCNWLQTMMNDEDVLLEYLFGDAFVVTGNDNEDSFKERMYEVVEEHDTKYGTWTEYGGYKKEYDNYDIYYKGN